MKTTLLKISKVLGLVTVLLASGQLQAGDKPVMDVFVLAGQSNMVGGASYDSLPGLLEAYAATNANVTMRTWLNGEEFGEDWEPLKPRGASLNFGPEMMLGYVLSDIHPERNLAFMKVAYNGTNLGCAWNPKGCGEHLFETLTTLMEVWQEELEDDDVIVRFAGFVWVQGEGDCSAQWAAENYEENLQSLIDGVRDATSDSNLPVVVAKVRPRTSNYPYVDLVHQGMDNVAVKDPNVATVTCESFELKIDLVHFTSTGMINLGSALADTMLGLDPFGLAEDEVPCASDLDGDGEVNVLDILRMISEFGPCP